MKLRVKLIAFFLLLLGFMPQIVWAATPLKIGDKGWKVKTVQMKLNIIGMRTPETGKFSKELAMLVKKFQRNNRLRPSGQVDDNTYHAILNAAFAKEGIPGVSPSALVNTAARYKGVPYVFGGTTPKGFDCSGYVQYVFKQHRAILPRTADVQFKNGMFVTQSALQVGDLVFFSTYEPGASHVGIYAGNGKFWSATSSHGVALCSLKESYWSKRYYGGRRVLTQVKNQR